MVMREPMDDIEAFEIWVKKILRWFGISVLTKLTFLTFLTFGLVIPGSGFCRHPHKKRRHPQIRQVSAEGDSGLSHGMYLSLPTTMPGATGVVNNSQTFDKGIVFGPSGSVPGAESITPQNPSGSLSWTWKTAPDDGEDILLGKKPQQPTETLSQCLLRRYRVYERTWNVYLDPCFAPDAKCENGHFSRTYMESEKQEFIRTIAALDKKGKEECKGKPVE